MWPRTRPGGDVGSVDTRKGRCHSVETPGCYMCPPPHLLWFYKLPTGMEEGKFQGKSDTTVYSVTEVD